MARTFSNLSPSHTVYDPRYLCSAPLYIPQLYNKSLIAKSIENESSWSKILSYPELASRFNDRSNVDLKDKWRNEIAGGNVVQSMQDKIAPPIYRVMIFDALLSKEDSEGLTVDEIYCFIEQRYEMPTKKFRRALKSKLRKLVLKGKLEKIDNCYKIKDIRPTNEENVNDGQQEPLATETLEDAAAYAAYCIAASENMSYAAANARKERDRLVKLAEDNRVLLKLAEELHQMCVDSPDGFILLKKRDKC